MAAKKPAQKPKERELVPDRFMPQLPSSKNREQQEKPVMEGGISVGTGDCAMCDICESAFALGGFVYCHEGVPFILNGWPTSGGPWAPCVYPNGTVVWANMA